MSRGEADLARVLAHRRRAPKTESSGAPDERQLTAYATGELSGPEAEAVRDFLALDPEAARFVLDVRESLASRPLAGEVPLSAAEMAADWSALERRLGAPETPGTSLPPSEAASASRPTPASDPVYSSPSHAWAVAASALLVALGLTTAWGLWLAREKGRLEREKTRLEEGLEAQGGPWANSTYVFLPAVEDHVREGVAPEPPRRLAVGMAPSLVFLAIPREQEYREFEVDAEELGPATPSLRLRVVGLRFDDEQQLSFSVTQHSLPPGVYRLRLYGTEGTDRRQISAYEVQVVPGPAP